MKHAWLICLFILTVIVGCDCNFTNSCPPSPTPTPIYQSRTQPRTCTPTISATPIALPIQPIGQICQQWCWAATITMVADYYGNSINICQPPSAQTGLNCCNWVACSNQVCNQPASFDQMVQHFKLLQIHGRIDYRALTEKEIQIEISNGRPVIVAYKGSFSGHVVLIMAFAPAANGNPNLYRVVDPYFGVFDVPYNQVRYGYQNGSFTWFGTFWKLRLEAEEPCS